jgi:hypothetical protein
MFANNILIIWSLRSIIIFNNICNIWSTYEIVKYFNKWRKTMSFTKFLHESSSIFVEEETEFSNLIVLLRQIWFNYHGKMSVLSSIDIIKLDVSFIFDLRSFQIRVIMKGFLSTRLSMMSFLAVNLGNIMRLEDVLEKLFFRGRERRIHLKLVNRQTGRFRLSVMWMRIER